MAQLGRAMGIATPSIYCANGNKAALFLAALTYYQRPYWTLYARYVAAGDIYGATETFFAEAARILLAPNAPCGRLIVMGFLNLPEDEPRLQQAIAKGRELSRAMFRTKLKDAVTTGQMPAFSDIPAISGALHNFLKGSPFRRAATSALPNSLPSR